MNCDGVRSLLSAYLDGELLPGELLRVEQHLRRCHACADEVDSLRQTIGLVATLEEVELPPLFHVHLHERLVALGPAPAIRRPVRAPAWQKNVRRWGAPAAAAAAALAIGLSTYSQVGLLPGMEAGGRFPPSLKPPVVEPANTPSAPNTTPTDPSNTIKPSGTPSTEVTAPGTEPTPAPPGRTNTDPGSARPVTDPPGGTQTTVIGQQVRPSAVLKIASDNPAKSATEFKKLYPQALELNAGSLQLVVKAGEFAAAKALLLQQYPAAQQEDTSSDMALEIARLESEIARLKSEQEALMKAPESDNKAARLADYASKLDVAREQLKGTQRLLESGVITVVFQTPVQ